MGCGTSKPGLTYEEKLKLWRMHEQRLLRRYPPRGAKVTLRAAHDDRPSLVQS